MFCVKYFFYFFEFESNNQDVRKVLTIIKFLRTKTTSQHTDPYLW